MGHCQEMSVHDLMEPLKQTIARMITRHCRNATACRLKEPAEFSQHHVVFLDGYPKTENRAISFRFFVMLPYEAVPLDKKIEKPLLSSKILAGELVSSERAQLGGTVHKLGGTVTRPLRRA